MDDVELGKELWSFFKCPIYTPSHRLAEEVKVRFCLGLGHLDPRFYSLIYWVIPGKQFWLAGVEISKFKQFFPPLIAFYVLQKGIEVGLEEIVVCGVVCIVYSILPLRVQLNLKQVLVLHVGKNVSVVVGASATLSLADRYLL